MNTHKVTDYFSGILERGQLEEVIFDDNDGVFVATTREQLITGYLTPGDCQKLFEAHDDKAPRSSHRSFPASNIPAETPTSSSRDSSIAVVVALASQALKTGGHNGLLLLSADLQRDGKLEPRVEATPTSPWIPSERLHSATITDNEIMVGSLRDFEQYWRSELAADRSQTTTFSEALGLAEILFKKVSGKTVSDFASEYQSNGLAVECEQCYVKEVERIDPVSGLLQVYDALKRMKKLPLLAERMITGWEGYRKPETTIHPDRLYDAAIESRGSMSDGFPLTHSQRRAVHAFFLSQKGDVTAVSGPPGTGKTTMLQSVVAGLVTRYALNKGPAPVIVAASTNNQAVTNVIDSFSSVTKEKPGPLDHRWLPKVETARGSEPESLRSLAVYCPSQTKLAHAKKRYLVEQNGRDQTYADYSNEEYLESARKYFSECAHTFFGEASDISTFQDKIHEYLKQLDEYRISLLKAMREAEKQGSTHSKYDSLCRKLEASNWSLLLPKITKLKDCRTLEAVDQELDVTLRYAQFWLAVHYYEAQWLLTEDFLPDDKRWKTTAEINDQYWRQATALTPCFVMTLYQVPKFFKRYKKDSPANFDFNRIDLLIVDEAGQVDTPLGLPSFALASRALVVGDEKQLPPVWSIDDETDREVAEGENISSQEWEENLRVRGLTCSIPSSLMRAASYASQWEYGDHVPGLFLSEHFRCHPTIIGFCNELLYKGLLEPKRNEKSSRLNGIIPAFLFKTIPGSKDSKMGSSRRNEREAKAIAEWIVQNYARLLEIYNPPGTGPEKKVAEDALIGVVTPFSAQSRLISQEIKKATPSMNLPKHLEKKITVGTAHRLQGAERPIILFSSVYGCNSSKATFIDKNLPLMNVAVSRAKDLFIVFGAENRWDNGPVFEVMSHFAENYHGIEMAPVSESEDKSRSKKAEMEPESQSLAHQVDTPNLTAETQPEDLTATKLLEKWKNEVILRPEDTKIKAHDFNIRLADVGVLEGTPGTWEPTRLARVLGVQVLHRRNSKNQPYNCIVYTQEIQLLLKKLYIEGKL